MRLIDPLDTFIAYLAAPDRDLIGIGPPDDNGLAAPAAVLRPIRSAGRSPPNEARSARQVIPIRPVQLSSCRWTSSVCKCLGVTVSAARAESMRPENVRKTGESVLLAAACEGRPGRT